MNLSKIKLRTMFKKNNNIVKIYLNSLFNLKNVVNLNIILSILIIIEVEILIKQKNIKVLV